MVIPPPNVTGTLHLGHALMGTIEDCLSRWHRMCGKSVLYLPGTDHAGIATQVVVEKRLWKQSKQTRHDLGREKFLEEVWKWKEEHGSYICKQFRSMGISVDWSREVFTMDEKLSYAVQTAFIRMFKKGSIYRANRLVNWSSHLLTAISDIEVDYITLEKPQHLKVPGHEKAIEFGVFHSFAYRLEGSDDPADEIVVATTRIETMLGDVAVAVHPEDERYKRFHGKFLVHPFHPDRKIAVITDPILVDMEKGTGAVKVTPAHDPNDFACGQRNNLEQINIFTSHGAMNENSAEFAGMMRFDARKKVIARLDELDLYRGKTPNPGMRLGLCSRSKDVVEPLLKPQWWVDCKEMASRAVNAVRSGELEIIPSSQETIWYHWLENIRDWCISRQLWWGHRIPAYHITVEGQGPVDDCDMNYWVVAKDENDALAQAQERFPGKAVQVEQDPDVLDTWFSSGLFPFSVFGWPNQTDDLAKFYPTTLLETGGDILFFWVARMVMMGLELTDKLPFKQVFLHPMVRDMLGRKMSKSLGNVVDPLDVVRGVTLKELNDKLKSGNLPEKEIAKALQEQQKAYGKSDGIPECGTDGLRFGLLSYMAQGRNINLNVYRVQGYRQFCNKIWNAVRYCMSHFDQEENFEAPVSGELDMSKATLFDSWIISRLHETIGRVNAGFEKFDFSESTNAIYTFMLEEFCGIYLEVTKPIFSANDDRAPFTRKVLYVCIDVVLKLLHPAMPFVTEELWQRLPGRKAEDTIMLARYPVKNADLSNENAEVVIGQASSIVHGLNSARASLGLTPHVKPAVLIQCSNEAIQSDVESTSLMIQKLATSESVKTLLSSEQVPSGYAPSVINEHITAYLFVKGLIDFEKEIARLDKKKKAVQKNIDKLKKRTSSQAYQDKSPDHIKQKDADSMNSFCAELESFESAIQGLEKLKISVGSE